MKKPKWLLDEFVLSVHELALAKHGGPIGVREESLFESALSRAKHKHQYEPESTMYNLAAAYSYGIAMNHPFVDGNKRTALICGLVFLEINGVEVDAPEAETVVAFESLAAGNLTEPQLSRWFENHSKS